jgi:hypothetical protein
LENYQKEFFGTPLPLFWRPGNPPLIPFDARRFQFFLYTIWGYLDPDRVLSPFHRDLQALAQTVSAGLLSERGGGFDGGGTGDDFYLAEGPCREHGVLAPVHPGTRRKEHRQGIPDR